MLFFVACVISLKKKGGRLATFIAALRQFVLTMHFVTKVAAFVNKLRI